ncbi:MAG TPA: replication initiator [Acidimicrobiales bacterium]|nr:replication initiator [Acidimicrobiales bacterium]
MQHNPAETPSPSLDVVAEAINRIASSGWDRLSAQLQQTGGCARPIRLKGGVRAVDLTTGELSVAYDSAAEPDGVLLKSCQARRSTVCPACAAVYKGDARQLILAGLTGGKGVTAEVLSRPLVFATLTAPSFGPVHTGHDEDRLCHPGHVHCPCGEEHWCLGVHRPGDPYIGTPICPSTYDYVGTVVWNNRVGELWRRTLIAARRRLARHLRVPVRSFGDSYRLAYLKVIEYQERGVVHVHALVRLDPAPESSDGPEFVDTGHLVVAVTEAAHHVLAPNPVEPSVLVRWGPQNRVDPVSLDGRRHLASYLAKYTTKSVGYGGAMDHRLDAGGVRNLQAPDHLKRLVQAAWDLGRQPALAAYHFQEWAHTLGYRGHWMTKSPNWSTTLGALRQARQQYRSGSSNEPPDRAEIKEWAYAGSGHVSAGDEWLAATIHASRQANRRARWEEQ